MIAKHIALLVLISSCLPSLDAAAKNDTCAPRSEKVKTAAKFVTKDRARVGFAGQFKMQKGYYKPLNVETVELETMCGDLYLKLAFDCGGLSIRLKEDEKKGFFRSEVIVAWDEEKDDARRFTCLAKSVDEDMIYGSRGNPFLMRDFVIDCAQPKDERDRKEFHIDFLSIDLYREDDDICIIRKEKSSTQMETVKDSDTIVGFAGQFKFADGHYQPLKLRNIKYVDKFLATKLELTFDCGQMDISMFHNPDSKSMDSTTIVATGKAVDGHEFYCQVPDTNGLFWIILDIEFKNKDVVIDCLDDEGNETGNQIIIDQISLKTIYAKSSN